MEGIDADIEDLREFVSSFAEDDPNQVQIEKSEEVNHSNVEQAERSTCAEGSSFAEGFTASRRFSESQERYQNLLNWEIDDALEKDKVTPQTQNDSHLPEENPAPGISQQEQANDLLFPFPTKDPCIPSTSGILQEAMNVIEADSVTAHNQKSQCDDISQSNYPTIFKEKESTAITYQNHDLSNESQTEELSIHSKEHTQHLNDYHTEEPYRHTKEHAHHVKEHSVCIIPPPPPPVHARSMSNKLFDDTSDNFDRVEEAFSLLHQHVHFPFEEDKGEMPLSDDWVRVTILEPGSLYIRLQPNRSKNLVFLHSFESAGKDALGHQLLGPVEKFAEIIKPGYLLWSINDQILVGRHFTFVVETLRKLADVPERVLLWRKAHWDLPDNLTPPGGHQQHCFKITSTYMQRVALFQTALCRNPIDKEKLQELSLFGIPDATALNGQVLPESPGLVPIVSLRPLVWRILLGYMPLDRDRCEEELQHKRGLYAQYTEHLSIKPSHQPEQKACEHAEGQEFLCTSAEVVGVSQSETKAPLKSQEMDHPLARKEDEVKGGSMWARYWQDIDLNEAIRKDVNRTYPELQFFIGDKGGERLRRLERVLFVYAKLNPGISYVQGMNEIVGTLLYVFASDTSERWSAHYEADTFFCFSNLMGELRDMYIVNLDETHSGLQGRLAHLSQMLKQQDLALWNCLDDLELDPTFYALRWITTLLTREFDLPSTIRLWDSLFATPHRSDFLCCLSCAMILHQREVLLAGSFESNLHLLQCYPPTDLQELLDKCFQLLNERNKTEGNRDTNQFSEVLSSLKNEAGLPLCALFSNTFANMTSNIKTFFVPSFGSDKS